mgnify:CR=1 FL=1
MRGFILGVAVTLVLAFFGGYFLVRSGLIPANADVKPSRLEIWMAQTSLEATLRHEAPKSGNPIALTNHNLIKGIHLFARHCAICHGTAKGMASASPIAKGLYRKPPQLATDGVEDDPQGFSFWKIKHGIRLTGMPSWKKTLTDRQIWTLALFLNHMSHLPPAAQRAWQNVKTIQ